MLKKSENTNFKMRKHSDTKIVIMLFTKQNLTLTVITKKLKGRTCDLIKHNNQS